MTQSVEAIWLTDTGPRMLRGHLSSSQNILVLQIATDERPPIGSRLILYGDDIQMLSTRVTQTSADSFVLEKENRPTDKRLHPRLFGNIPTRIQLANDTNIQKWLDGELDIENGWLKPEPFMNFSVNGLSFDLSTPLKSGATCLVEFSVGDQNQKHRTQATVVRSVEKSGVYEIAVHFLSLSQNAKNLLSEFTLSIQEALLQK
ncbi:MAG: PilZ domain-containing protein [Myxococcota bacterium]|nr:PilZ domain-containing protein [Myxococcota bacterium]